jgi:hypothetical protein
MQSRVFPREVKASFGNRLFASVLALAAFAAQVQSAAHFAAVRHVACADHGGWIEVTSAHPRDALQPSSAVVNNAGEEHGHDHCALAALRRERAQLRSTGQLIPLDRAHEAERAAHPCPPSRAFSALTVAPKNSPPA